MLIVISVELDYCYGVVPLFTKGIQQKKTIGC